MCLIIKKQEPQTATEDMKVYKVMRNRASLVQNFVYNFNQLYKTTIQESRDRACADNTAQRYLRDNVSDNWWDEFYTLELMSIGQGFHSCKTHSRAMFLKSDWMEGRIHEATIPAGSQYYEDPTGLIVSDQIIVHG